MKKKILIAILIILGVLLVDQSLKIWVKTNMQLGEEIHLIGDRVMLRFIENPGMAFGMELGGNWGKVALSIFRILAVSGLVWYLCSIIKKYNNMFIIVCISLIIAGAMGNLLDCAFYGIMFSDSFGRVAEFMPAEGGYAPLLYGHVVDMFYCPVINTTIPQNFPFWAGEQFVFFRPIFNVADSAITISVFIMIIFYKKIFKLEPKDNISSDKKGFDENK